MAIKRIKNILKLFLPYGIIVLHKKHKEYKKTYAEKEHHFDIIFSVGIACRPAHYLKKYKLRLCSNPLDWMMSYSLETTAHLYQSKFNDFFIEFEEKGENSNIFFDKKNEITSLHFSEIGTDNNAFNKKMKNRFKRANKRLKKADKICFISNRNENVNLFSDFLKKMGTIYSGEITLINIKNNIAID
ncbi:DUF1796 family putative cysteine peptidase, partial [Algibacter sp.]|uniref:DUF1796 family putative cysteine peptidase n=1 Tax=Algibacter sp. TaxID=1872428 RepID=UPI003C710AEC